MKMTTTQTLILPGVELLTPDWPAPPSVRACMTTRRAEQGASAPPFDRFNTATHVGDAPAAVAANRAWLRQILPAEPLWLNQVHGAGVVVHEGSLAGPSQERPRPPGGRLGFCEPGAHTLKSLAGPPQERLGLSGGDEPKADASVAHAPGRVCVVQTADCLPVLFCTEDGAAVAAAHAGWRGLAAGVLEAAAAALGCPPRAVLAWLGAAIGPAAFEVGEEVRDAFTRQNPQTAAAFTPGGAPGKWLADLYALARIRLAAIGVERVYGGGLCTVSDATRFYSYRRENRTGRMAALIWLNKSIAGPPQD